MQQHPPSGSPRAPAAAQALARSVMDTRAMAAELRIIAYDIRLRAQAERRRARLLALGTERPGTAAQRDDASYRA